MVEAGDLGGRFSTGAELLARLAQSQDIRSCFAETYFTFAGGHDSTPEDRCALDAVKKTFQPTGDLRQLVAAIASSDSFRLRTSEGGAP
jgi:hypothetical protein